MNRKQKIDEIYSKMISQLSRNHTDKSETYSSQYYPYISIDSILKLSEMSHFVINNQILHGFQTEIDKINLKIEIWIRKQWVFVFAYKDMAQNYADSRQLIDRDQYSVASDKEVLSKKLYNKLMPTLASKTWKERMFWEDNWSFKFQRSVQNIQIPSADEWDLKFTDENEAEISQILYFGYKDSLFYDKFENKWHKEFKQNKSNMHWTEINDLFCNSST